MANEPDKAGVVERLYETFLWINSTIRPSSRDPKEQRVKEAIVSALSPPPVVEEAERCQKCGRHNPSWSAPSPLWNAVMRGGSINGEALFSDMVCATCFMTLAEESGIAEGWRVTAQRVHLELETVTPSGRIWSDELWLWRDASAPTPPAGEEEVEAIRSLHREEE